MVSPWGHFWSVVCACVRRSDTKIQVKTFPTKGGTYRPPKRHDMWICAKTGATWDGMMASKAGRVYEPSAAQASLPRKRDVGLLQDIKVLHASPISEKGRRAERSVGEHSSQKRIAICRASISPRQKNHAPSVKSPSERDFRLNRESRSERDTEFGFFLENQISCS